MATKTLLSVVPQTRACTAVVRKTREMIMACPRWIAAFALVKLLVVIAIIGIIITLLLPDVQAAREAARRNSCHNKIRQLAIAVQNFESAHGHVPEIPPAGLEGKSFFVQILPYIEGSVVAELFEPYLQARKQLRTVFRGPEPTRLCPSDQPLQELYAQGFEPTNSVSGDTAHDYKDNFGINWRTGRFKQYQPIWNLVTESNQPCEPGPLEPQEKIALRRLSDGESNTLVLIEMLAAPTCGPDEGNGSFDSVNSLWLGEADNSAFQGTLELMGSQATVEIAQLANDVGPEETTRWISDSDGTTPLVVTGVENSSDQLQDPNEVGRKDVVLTLESLSGDLNNAGIVNVADYTDRLDNLVAPGDSVINGAGDDLPGGSADDYLMWKANFGQVLAQPFLATRVPEPIAAFLLGGWVVAGLRIACPRVGLIGRTWWGTNVLAISTSHKKKTLTAWGVNWSILHGPIPCWRGSYLIAVRSVEMLLRFENVTD